MRALTAPKTFETPFYPHTRRSFVTSFDPLASGYCTFGPLPRGPRRAVAESTVVLFACDLFEIPFYPRAREPSEIPFYPRAREPSEIPFYPRARGPFGVAFYL
jgi:hypothetical protein